MRKTTNVETVRNRVNILLANPNVSDEYRLGAAAILESILHDTGNYQGYSYVGIEFPKGEDPIIPNMTMRHYF
jgi:hypothetical protein